MIKNLKKEKSKNSKRLIPRAFLGIGVLLAVVIIGFELFNNYILSMADQNFNKDEFAIAKQYYQTALHYSLRKDDNIQTKIQNCNIMQSSLDEFNRGTELLKNKSYLSAINAFQGVIPQDEKRFDLAKDKIAESRNLYIEELVGKAKSFESQKEYNSAIQSVKEILDFDPNNESAKTLLTQYENELAQIEAQQAKAKADASKKEALETKVSETIAKLRARGVSEDAIKEYLDILSSRYGIHINP
jgi:tetratricopeptide (TPR) repeat protein